MTITRFVNIRTGATYTFPTSPADQDYNPRLQNMETHITPLAGVDGGYDEDGLDRGNAGNGIIQVSVYLVSTTRAGMQAKRDALNTISSWGMGVLYDTTGAGERWAFCKVTNIDVPEKRHENTDLFQRVQLTFLCNPPFWHTAGNTTIWDAGENWDGGANWDKTGSNAISGSTYISITNNGSAYTLPTIAASYSSGTVRFIEFKRVINGEAVDRVRYEGTLTSGQWLEIDCLRQRVTIQPDGTNVFNQFTYEHPDWFRLESGSNDLYGNSDGGLLAYITYMERYK
jgi:phage-related protein